MIRSIPMAKSFVFEIKWISILLLVIQMSSVNPNLRYPLCDFSENDASEKTHEIYCKIRQQDCSSNDGLNASEVTQLKIVGCDFRIVMDNLKIYKYVRGLDISYSGYESMNALEIMHDHVTTINASHNSVLNIPKWFFNNTPELSEIDFSYNVLWTIKGVCFGCASKLSKIHLSHNTILHMDESAFAELSQLEFVDLRSNKIMEIDFLILNSTNLREVHLEENIIERLDCSYFSLIMNRTSVYVSWKYVEVMNMNCLTGQVQVMSNSSDESVLLAPDKRIEFHCRENSFQNVRDFFAGKRTTNVLEITQCLGESLSKMDISGSHLSQLNTNAFRKFTNLRTLSLSGSKLTEFDFGMLEHQRKLKSLDISYNNFHTMKNISLLESLFLREFTISGNHLNNTIEILQYLNPSVRFLDVSDNNLSELKVTTFRKLNSLTQLNMRNVNLFSLDAKPFLKLEKLKHLDVSSNDLEHFDFTLISSILRNLLMFKAVGCRLKNISDVLSAFGMKPSLGELHLSENYLGDIPFNAFKLFDLYRLNLSNTQLSQFAVTLWNQENLSYLNISYNDLETIDFTHLPPGLYELNLEWNDLTQIDDLTSTNFPYLRKLAIAQNRLSCAYLSRFLTHVKTNWTKLEFISDPLIQKHEQNCHFKNTEKVSAFIYIILFCVAIVMLVALTYILILGTSNTFKRFSQTHAQDQPPEPQVFYIATESDNNTIYEEIIENDYDQLNFGFGPKPVSDTNGHYKNIDFIHRRTQNAIGNVQNT